MRIDCKLHEASSMHREQVFKSEICGCFYCLRAFKPDQINEWTDGGRTALCPECGIDSVIGSESYPITKDFLKAMYERWFTVKIPSKYNTGEVDGDDEADSPDSDRLG